MHVLTFYFSLFFTDSKLFPNLFVYLFNKRIYLVLPVLGARVLCWCMGFSLVAAGFSNQWLFFQAVRTLGHMGFSSFSRQDQ